MIVLPVRKVYNHKKVWTHPVMDSMRVTESLCSNCANQHGDPLLDCPIAGQLYLVSQQNDIAVAVTRCPKWKLKEVVSAS